MGCDFGGWWVILLVVFECVVLECLDWLLLGVKDMWGCVVFEFVVLNLLKEFDFGVLIFFCVVWD